jgi:hypothetical protein
MEATEIKKEKDSNLYFSTHSTNSVTNSTDILKSTSLHSLLLRDQRQCRRKGKRREKNLVMRARPFQILNLVQMLVTSLTLVSSDDNITIYQHKIPGQSEGMGGGGGWHDCGPVEVNRMELMVPPS